MTFEYYKPAWPITHMELAKTWKKDKTDNHHTLQLELRGDSDQKLLVVGDKKYIGAIMHMFAGDLALETWFGPIDHEDGSREIGYDIREELGHEVLIGEDNRLYHTDKLMQQLKTGRTPPSERNVKWMRELDEAESKKS